MGPVFNRSETIRFLLVFLLFALVMGAAGLAVPFLLVREIPPGLTEGEKIAAEYARLQVRRAIGGSMEPFLALRLRIRSIEKLPGRSVIVMPGKDVEQYIFDKTYFVTVDAITFFGIKYSRFLVRCDETLRQGGVERLPSTV